MTRGAETQWTRALDRNMTEPVGGDLLLAATHDPSVERNDGGAVIRQRLLALLSAHEVGPVVGDEPTEVRLATVVRPQERVQRVPQCRFVASGPR